jgi:hypothetical protein
MSETTTTNPKSETTTNPKRSRRALWLGSTALAPRRP